MEEINSRQKGSRWLSLFSVLMAAQIKPLQVVLVEHATTGVWDFAFWNYDPDGIVCTYRRELHHTLWVPVESPVYSGRIKPWDKPNDPRKQYPHPIR